MEAIVYAHGAPPCMSALLALAVQGKKHEFWQSYVADSLCIANRIWGGREILPMYTQMLSNNQATKDERTANEVIEDIKARMRKGMRE